jgi:glycosyltransferase involved in cell wall biosynthesis
MGEGFGIPAIEAQACGTPVVVSDASAQPELIGEGWAVRGQPWFDVPQKSWLMAPSVPDIVEALELAYQRGRSRSDKAIEFAQQYDADKVFSEMWVPTLEAL